MKLMIDHELLFSLIILCDWPCNGYFIFSNVPSTSGHGYFHLKIIIISFLKNESKWSSFDYYTELKLVYYEHRYNKISDIATIFWVSFEILSKSL